MGFKKWFARKGNVGGIARNVAEGWRKIESQRLGISPKEIAEAYASIRFGLISDYAAKKALNNISGGKIRTPLELAWFLLKEENPDELDFLLENYHEWIEIMREEMEKKGLNPDLEL
jgi:hypothetical protein